MAAMHDDTPTDAELVAGSLMGNREAFGCLYDRYARLVRAVAYGVTLDWPMVQDLTQETFLRAFRNLGRLHEPERFGAWVSGIARQVARERRRSLRRDRHEFVGRAQADIVSEATVDNTNDDDEEIDFILRKLAELDDRQRLAIHAFFLEERDVNQTAELLELSRSGTYAFLSRALARLTALVRRHEQGKR